MGVSKRLRFEILRRDNYTCRYCGASAPDVVLHVDHVLAEALGGKNEASNLITACEDCNLGKSATTVDDALVEQVTDDAFRWARAIKAAAAITAAERTGRRADEVRFLEMWNRWTAADSNGPVSLPSDVGPTIDRFLALGLTFGDFEELVRIAMTSGALDVFRYFAACCWNRIDEIQKIAVDLIARGEIQ